MKAEGIDELLECSAPLALVPPGLTEMEAGFCAGVAGDGSCATAKGRANVRKTKTTTQIAKRNISCLV